jgi:hypothetical protein
MVHQGADSYGPAVDPQEGLRLELASDARSAVAKVQTRFDMAMAKPNTLDDVDVSKGTILTRDMAKVEEAGMNGARAELAQASSYLSAILVARFGAARQLANGNNSKAKQQSFGEGSNKPLKRSCMRPRMRVRTQNA